MEKAKVILANEYYCKTIHEKKDCENSNCFECCADYLIEIVKKDGVSDAVCEWNIDGVYIFSPHSRMFSCVIDDKHRYTYCPVCGKKIKVEEQMDEDELRYCHHDDTDEYHDCLDYMECEECPYYYADLDQESD